MLLLLLFSIIGVVTCQDIPNKEWGYGETTEEVYGPPDWHIGWEECGHDRQSPININSSQVVSRTYPSLKMTFDNQGGVVTGKLENTGHSPTLTIDKSQGTAVLTGGPLGDTSYTLNQFHVHFGCQNDRGSEHTYNGEQFAGQLHMVFEDTGRYAVVALWLKNSSTGNPILEKFANLLPNIIEVGSSTEVERSDSIRLMELLPNNNNDIANSDDDNVLILPDYYHYHGSLTTPSCYETVKWLIQKRKVLISNQQLAQFRKLKSHYGRFPDLMCDNYRPLQPLNDRRVYSVTRNNNNHNNSGK